MSTAYDDFREILTAAAGYACRCLRTDLAETLARIAPNATLWTRGDIDAQWPGLTDDLLALGIDVLADGQAEAVRDQEWGLTTARAAIAETGSVILHENRLEHRSVSLMTQSLIVLCPMKELLPSLDDAARILREIGSNSSSYASLVSGPSRTADIERQLTIGVQGPGAMYVLLVDDVEAPGNESHRTSI